MPLDESKILKFPRTLQGHILADYIELRCLVSQDGETGRDEIEGLVEKQKDFEESEGIEEGHGIEGSPYAAPEVSDSKREQIDSWFDHLQYRAEAFNGFYPFVFTKEPKTLFRRNSFKLVHKLYVSLLLSSSLQYFSKQTEQYLSQSFEIISLLALRNYLPNNAEVHHFGKNPLNRGRYAKGNVWERIKKLSGDLHEAVIPPKSDFSSHDTGDYGVDIVGWIPACDTNKGFLIVFGQCACSESWREKQHESSSSRWNHIMTFMASPNNMSFIPFCFREPDGSWFSETKLENSIWFDRLRLVNLLQNQLSFFQDLPSFGIVNKVLQQRIPII